MAQRAPARSSKASGGSSSRSSKANSPARLASSPARPVRAHRAGPAAARLSPTASIEKTMATSDNLAARPPARYQRANSSRGATLSASNALEPPQPQAPAQRRGLFISIDICLSGCGGQRRPLEPKLALGLELKLQLKPPAAKLAAEAAAAAAASAAATANGELETQAKRAARSLSCRPAASNQQPSRELRAGAKNNMALERDKER